MELYETPEYPAMLIVVNPKGSNTQLCISKVSEMKNEVLGKAVLLSIESLPVELNEAWRKKAFFSEEVIKEINVEELGKVIKEAALRCEKIAPNKRGDSERL